MIEVRNGYYSVPWMFDNKDSGWHLPDRGEIAPLKALCTFTDGVGSTSGNTPSLTHGRGCYCVGVQARNDSVAWDSSLGDGIDQGRVSNPPPRCLLLLMTVLWTVVDVVMDPNIESMMVSGRWRTLARWGTYIHLLLSLVSGSFSSDA